MKTYLDQPIVLYGIRIGHTHEGLKHLVEHYTHTLAHAVAQKKISENDRQHCEKMIENYKQHIQLYEKFNTEKMKHVLVTGAAGFIGSHLVAALLQSGYKVTGIDSMLTGQNENVPSSDKYHSNYTFIYCATKEIPAISTMDCDYVIHLASPASPTAYQRYWYETYQANVVDFDLLLRSFHKKARIILASTSEVYGSPQVHPQPESYWGNVNSFGPRSVYDESKRMAETLAWCYNHYHNANVGIARIFNTYGPNMRPDDGRVIPNFIQQALNNKSITLYGDGKQTRCFCYVTDLVNGLMALMHSDCRQPVNLGNTDEVTMIELANCIKMLSNSNSELILEPLPVDDPERRKPDISKAMDLLKWKPVVTLEEGLSKTIQSFKK